MRPLLALWLILAPMAASAQQSDSATGSAGGNASASADDTDSAKIKSDAQKKADALRQFCKDPANAGKPPCPPAAGK